MWFSPDNLLTPSATSATSATQEGQSSKVARVADTLSEKTIDLGFEISKLAGLAEGKNQIFVICYSPSGRIYEVKARDQDHAEFLKRMNPPPMNKELSA